MNYKTLLLSILSFATMHMWSCDKDNNTPTEVTQETNVTLTPSDFSVNPEAGTVSMTILSDQDWTLSSNATWVEISPSSGIKGISTEVKVTYKANTGYSERTATINAIVNFRIGATATLVQTGQETPSEISVPEGYSLVWHDEFDSGETLSDEWVIENQASGWVNNELQNYTSKTVDGKSTTEIKDGLLHINCFKGSDGKIYSGRVYAKPSEGWTYGFFEARINLPSGKGTWPAFWMMPSNNDWSTNGWPRCGEIDIMEEVGVDANRVSSSLHTENYNHTKNTQKTHEMYLEGAEGEFHVYALEWTPDEITTYVDGQLQLNAKKKDMGSSHESWPFYYAFYPILNLAWGGDWGGYQGVDESALPVTMLVDYVRIFQK